MWKRTGHTYVLVGTEDKLVPVNLESMDIFQDYKGLESSFESESVVVLGNLKTGLKSVAAFLKEQHENRTR